MVDDREALVVQFLKDAGCQRLERLIGNHAVEQIPSLRSTASIPSIQP